MHENWERYEEKLRKCPHHGIPRWMQVHSFYDGLNNTSWTLLYTSVGGALMKKNENEAYKLLEGMITNNYLWPSERLSPPKKVAGIHGMDVLTNLAAQVALLTQQMQKN